MGTLIRIALFTLVLVAGTTQVADPLVISSGNDRTIPIATVSFGFQGGSVLPEGMSNIIGNDLRNSGCFESLPRQSIISQPAQASEVIFRDRKTVGVNYAMVGNIVPASRCLQMQYALFDVGTEQQVLTGSVTGSTDQLHNMSCCIADRSFEKFTGTKGTFSAKTLYIAAERFSVNNTRYTLQHSSYDGARPVTLLQSCEPTVSPRFSPGGRCIVHVSFEQKRPCIFIQYVDIDHREQVTNFEGPNGTPALSPDDNRLVSILSRDGNPEIYVMGLGSHALRRLTNSLAVDTEPFWGKDDSTLYFTSDRDGESQIYKMNVNNGTVDRITFIGNYNTNPKLPAGERILIMAHRQRGYTNFQVTAQDLQRSDLWVLSNTTLDDLPIIASNDTMLIYAICQQDRGVLMLVSINGRARIPPLTAQDDVYESSWSSYLN